MYWSPNFLVAVFKKQEISQQVVTRMQNLASEFSQIFRQWSPRTLTAGGGDPLPHPTPSPLALRPGVGSQTLVPSTFQPWLRPSICVSWTVCYMCPVCFLLVFLFLSALSAMSLSIVYFAYNF